jgi:hypothetical protein
VIQRQIFVSRPTDIARSQQAFCSALERVLASRDLVPRTVGSSDFTSQAPLKKILQLMDECDGACILGLVQARADTAVFKPGTKRERTEQDVLFPSPWNHLEAGMALVRGLPLLVIREDGVLGGIFDRDLGAAFVHELPARAKERWLRGAAFQQSLAEWMGLMGQRLRPGSPPN